MTTPEASIATSILTSPVPSARGYFDAVASNDLGDTSISDVARIIVEQADVVTLFEVGITASRAIQDAVDVRFSDERVGAVFTVVDKVASVFGDSAAVSRLPLTSRFVPDEDVAIVHAGRVYIIQVPDRAAADVGWWSSSADPVVAVPGNDVTDARTSEPEVYIVEVPKVENDVTCFTVDAGNAANYFPVGPVPYE